MDLGRAFALALFAMIAGSFFAGAAITGLAWWWVLQ